MANQLIRRSAIKKIISDLCKKECDYSHKKVHKYNGGYCEYEIYIGWMANYIKDKLDDVHVTASKSTIYKDLKFLSEEGYIHHKQWNIKVFKKLIDEI